MPLELQHAQPRYRPPMLVEPPPAGYVLLSAEIEPPTGRAPRPGRSPAKQALLGRLRSLADDVQRVSGVDRVTVYQTVLSPPPMGYARTATHPARFDVLALVETASPEVIGAVEMSDEFQQFRKELASTALRLDSMSARCVKCISDVDKTQSGLYLFNYFVAADVDVALELWDHLAGWYMTETGLENSTLLRPLGEAEFAFVNHARWDYGLPSLVLHQAKPSFLTFVRGNLDHNKTGAMPILCRRV